MNFEINFNTAFRQAGEMDRCAEELQHQQRNLVTLIGNVRRAWQGNTSNEYIKKLEILAQQLQNDATQYSYDAKAFRAKIEKIKQAEQEAARAVEASISEGVAQDG